jgi:hypothetical protein
MTTKQAEMREPPVARSTKLHGRLLGLLVAHGSEVLILRDHSDDGPLLRVSIADAASLAMVENLIKHLGYLGGGRDATK